MRGQKERAQKEGSSWGWSFTKRRWYGKEGTKLARVVCLMKSARGTFARLDLASLYG